MILVKRQSLRDSIVQLLCYSPNMSAQDIHREANRARPYTPQAVFKELRKLQEESAVVRIRKRYSLNITWAFELMRLSDVVEKNYVSQDALRQLLPAQRRKASWAFHDLLRMKNFWGELVILLVKHSNSHCVLSWNPHPWAYLLRTSSESQFLRALDAMGGKMYKIIGGTTYLDRWSKKLWERANVEYSFAPSPFEDEHLYFNVVDDYVISIELDALTSAAIDDLYRSIHSDQEVSIPELISFFRRKVNGTVTLEHNPRKAQSYRRKFQQFFGFRNDEIALTPPVAAVSAG